jgi:hypothetical protein
MVILLFHDEAGRGWTDVEPQGLAVVFGDEKTWNGQSLFSVFPFPHSIVLGKRCGRSLAPATLG